MKITKILAPEATPAKTILDRAAHIALTSEQRAHLPNEVTVNGQTIEVSIENARALEVGDALLDETGHFYVVEAAPEPILVIKAEEEMAAEALCEIVFEKAADTVCCGYKKGLRRKMTYERYDRILRAGLRKMRRIYSDCS